MSATFEEALSICIFILIEEAYNSCEMVKPIIYGKSLTKLPAYVGHKSFSLIYFGILKSCNFLIRYVMLIT